MDKFVLSAERYGPKSYHLVDDDFIDRLNNRITITGLTMCIFVVSANIYVGKPINCWTPGIFDSIQNTNMFII